MLHSQRHHLEASAVSQEVTVPILEFMRACACADGHQSLRVTPTTASLSSRTTDKVQYLGARSQTEVVRIVQDEGDAGIAHLASRDALHGALRGCEIARTGALGSLCCTVSHRLGRSRRTYRHEGRSVRHAVRQRHSRDASSSSGAFCQDLELERR